MSIAADTPNPGQIARRVAAVRHLPQHARAAAYADLADDLYGDRVQYIGGIGLSLDLTDGVTSVKVQIGPDPEHFALLDPAEANRAVTALLGITLTATARAR
jgi:hypothetical protein